MKIWVCNSCICYFAHVNIKYWKECSKENCKNEIDSSEDTNYHIHICCFHSGTCTSMMRLIDRAIAAPNGNAEKRETQNWI